MSSDTPKPVIQLIPASQGGGFRVSFSGHPDISGAGATIELALQALSARIASQYASEKGDETAAAQDASKQGDTPEGYASEWDRPICGVAGAESAADAISRG